MHITLVVIWLALGFMVMFGYPQNLNLAYSFLAYREPAVCTFMRKKQILRLLD